MGLRRHRRIGDRMANEIEDILTRGANSLDITPTMFKEATSHYKAVGEFLGNNGIEADVSPCGSILTGTVVRPYSETDDAYFDIDVLVDRTGYLPQSTSPEGARKQVEHVLLDSDRYGKMTTTCRECETVEFVANGIEGGFRLDLNTCVKGPHGILATSAHAEKSIAIAWKNPGEWHGSNPRGLCDWFIEKNERFAAAGRALRKAEIFGANKGVFNSVEEVPDSLDRSAMQRAVQVLKRSRDEYYTRCRKSERKPASCVIMTIVGYLSDELTNKASIADFLLRFADQACAMLSAGPSTKALANPVYNENMVESWDATDFETFSSWTREIARNIADLKEGTPAKRSMAAEAVFGSKAGKKALPASLAAVAAPSIVIPSKPWAK